MKKTISGNDDVWGAFFRIVDSIREFHSEVKDKIFYKLTYNQLRMIQRVYVFMYRNNGKGISLKILAERLGITPAAASEMVNTLVKKEVLIRSVDSSDRRVVSICVSDELQKLFARCQDDYALFTDGFLCTLDEDKRRLFTETVKEFERYTIARCAEKRILWDD